ncbi:MAG: glycosyltransferase [Dehalococcoidia bacterium]|nr:glycosyltransferase [Dehalococcoidia bacterium]
MRPHVVLFSPFFRPLESGAELFARKVVEHLEGLVTFSVVTLRVERSWPAEEDLGPHARLYRVGPGRGVGGKYAYPWWALRQARQLPPAALVHGVLETFAGYPTWRLKHSRRVPSILTLQLGRDLSDLLRRTWWAYPVVRRVYTSADRVTVPSAFIAGHASAMGVDPARVRFVPNSVDPTLFSPRGGSPAARQATRARLQLPPAAFVVISVSRLERKNGVDLLVEALADPRLRDVFLLLCGTGSLDASLRSRLAENGGLERVRFVGYLPQEELPALLAASDAFVRASRTEGLGSAFLEAMAMGLPTVGTTVGGIPEFLTTQTGFPIPPERPTAIADALVEIRHLSSEARRARTDAARALVAASYIWSRSMDRMRAVYEELLGPLG